MTDPAPTRLPGSPASESRPLHRTWPRCWGRSLLRRLRRAAWSSARKRELAGLTRFGPERTRLRDVLREHEGATGPLLPGFQLRLQDLRVAGPVFLLHSPELVLVSIALLGDPPGYHGRLPEPLGPL